MKLTDFAPHLQTQGTFFPNGNTLTRMHSDIKTIYLKVPLTAINNIFPQKSKKPDGIHYSDLGFGLIERKGRTNQRRTELEKQMKESLETFDNLFPSNLPITHKGNYFVFVAKSLNHSISREITEKQNRLYYRRSGKPYKINTLEVYYSDNDNIIKK